MSQDHSLPPHDDVDDILEMLDNPEIGVSADVMRHSAFEERHGYGEGGYDPLMHELGLAEREASVSGLSIDEHRFAVLVANTGKITDSYTQVFETEGLDRGDVYNYAARLARRSHVRAKVSEIREQIAKAAGMGVTSLVALVDEAIEMGRTQQDPKVILSAVDRLSALLGIGENQKRKDTQNVVVMLDDETRNRMLGQLSSLKDDIIDVTPTHEVPE